MRYIFSIVLAVFVVGVQFSYADHFKPLSTNHTSYGVAQLTYGNVPGRRTDDFRPAMKLMNPVHVTQVAAAIVYESDRGFRPGDAEVYVTCVLRVLTPHASVGIPESTFNSNTDVAKYVEVIWAPVDEIFPERNGERRLADGLGGYFHTQFDSREGPAKLAHPGLFSLPSDDVVPGQRQAAIDCILNGLASLQLPNDIFEDFGIPNPPGMQENFSALSPDHTRYGVAQLNYTNIRGRESSSVRPALKLMNPVHVTQVAAAIVYESDRGRNPGNAEVYVTCVLRVLTPHASVGIPESTFNTINNTLPKYAEVIWAPVEEIFPSRDGERRLADGLGGYSDGPQEGPGSLAHPGLFSLPSDDVVPGQRQAAIDCVCDGLANLELPGDIFSDFGIGPCEEPDIIIDTPAR